MRAFHVCALMLTFAILFTVFSCAHQPIAIAEPHINAWTLPADANPQDRFCALILPSPSLPPENTGLRCTSVLTVRQFLGGQREAH